MTDTRPEPPAQADERTTLTAFLDFQRATLAWKCADLTDEQLRTRAVPPSSMSLLGLVRHLADVERGWFRRTLNGEAAPPLFYSDDEPDGEFDNVDSADVAEAFTTWEAECAASRDAVANAADLDASGTNRHGEEFSLRWILTHMIEEYARHNGHADLLRESIDGATGE